MGIKGIKALIKKHVPDAIRPIDLTELNGKTVCIDSSILIYKYSFIYSSDNFHILGFLNKILELRNNNINMIFVFDGKPPEAKREILNKRKEQNNLLKENVVKLQEELKLVNYGDEYIDSDTEAPDDPEEFEKIKKVRELTKKISSMEKNVKKVTVKHSQEIMEILKSLGIPFFIAETEAEKACVFLQKYNHADYILTEDTDSLAFGGNFIFSKKNSYFLCEIDKVLQGLDLSQAEFTDLCIFCGCDYTCTIPKIGPVSALNIIKKHRSIDNFLKSSDAARYTVPESFDYQTARDLFIIENSTIELKGSKDRTKFLELLSRWNLNSFNFFNLINLI